MKKDKQTGCLDMWDYKYQKKKIILIYVSEQHEQQ